MGKPQSRPTNSFAEASAEHHREIYRAALRLTRNTADAEDLTQETYLRALRGSRGFAWGTNLRAWLMTILRNASLNRRRDAARRLVVADSRAVEQSEAPDQRDNPEAQLLRRVLPRELQSALESLPETLRTTVWLRDVDELSYAEIARQLAIPIGTVMSRLSRAREMLFRHLSDRAQEFPDDRSGSAAAGRVARGE